MMGLLDFLENISGARYVEYRDGLFFEWNGSQTVNVWHVLDESTLFINADVFMVPDTYDVYQVKEAIAAYGKVEA